MRILNMVTYLRGVRPVMAHAIKDWELENNQTWNSMAAPGVFMYV